MAISISDHQIKVQRNYEQVLFDVMPLLTLLQSGKSRGTDKLAHSHQVLRLYV